MKVILINPASSLINKSWPYRRFCTPIAPLGLAYIAGLLQHNNINVSIYDQFADKTSDAVLLRHICDENPDIIGFSGLTPVIPDIRRLVSAIRKESKKSLIILGNIHGTCFPESILNEATADVVVRGEGELTMLELCKCLIERRDFFDIEGISFKMNDRVVHNPDRKHIDDLDSLPYPSWNLLDLDNYLDSPMVGINKRRALPILASRGCKYRCYYCSQDKIYDKVRFRNLNKVVDEIEYFNKMYGVGFFGFCDSYFPSSEDLGMEFCELISSKKLDKKIKWITETRVDKITPRLLKAMKGAGAHLIMYGVEVGNEDILRSLNKGTTLNQARFAVRETKNAGILVEGLFMLGLPGETTQTCKDTIKFAKELDCDMTKFNIATPYPGSRFFDDFKNKLKDVDLNYFTSWNDWLEYPGDFVYNPDGIDQDTLRYLQRKAMLDFYARPRIVLRHIFKGTISFKNIFFGGFWLLWLFCLMAVRKAKIKSRRISGS